MCCSIPRVSRPSAAARWARGLILGSALIAIAGNRALAAAGDDAALDAKTQNAMRLFKSISWQEGPGIGKLGTIAQIKIPAGYRFTGQEGAAKWAELNENIPTPAELGVLLPKDHSG